MKVRQLLLWSTAYLVLLSSLATDGKWVVVIPSPLTSHTKYLTNVARELARLGHQVWLTMPDYIVSKGVLDTSNFTVIEYKTLTHFEEILMQGLRYVYFQGLPQDSSRFCNVGIQYCDHLLVNQSFLQQVKALAPDLFVLSSSPAMKMLTVIPYRLGVPFAFVGSTYDPGTQRIPTVLCNIPFFLFGFSHHMTFYQRVITYITQLFFSLSNACGYKDAVSRYAPEMTYLPIDMLVARAEIWLVESDHILDYPKPCMPNVKLIGGTATGPAKPLPSDFQSFMEDAVEGVVIVSFGTYILSPPKAIIDKIFTVLKDLPFKSVYRSNMTSSDRKKILTSSWIPQNDLLAHPNTRVFVSHCGKNGQYEALYHAVPVVATPIFEDQFYNAERMRVKGFAETEDLNTVSADELRATILKVATNTSYKQAITKASELFKIEFGVPMERAAFWLDHVMKYGSDHMRSAGHEIPFYQFSCWDVYGFLFGFFFFAGIACNYIAIVWTVQIFRHKVQAKERVTES